MGTYAHLKVLVKEKNREHANYSGTFTFDHLVCAPDDRMFAKMVGVCNDEVGYPDNECYKPKGLIKKVGVLEIESLLCIVSDDFCDEKGHYCTKEEANEYVENEEAVRVGKYHITNPNYHTYSWLTVEQFEKCIKYVEEHDEIRGVDVTWHALLSYMKTLAEDYDVIVMFAFDS